MAVLVIVVCAQPTYLAASRRDPPIDNTAQISRRLVGSNTGGRPRFAISTHSAFGRHAEAQCCDRPAAASADCRGLSPTYSNEATQRPSELR